MTRLLHWTHLHTFAGGLAAGLVLTLHWWVLLAVLTGAVAMGCLLGLLLARGAWAASGLVARLIERGKMPAAPSFPVLTPPADAEWQVIVKPRRSRYDR